ncbi:MAG TPA: AAA family ATPase, partial [Urbifossiella sp.]|nr:AAA family ATPase [Urbifossiella sp.]
DWLNAGQRAAVRHVLTSPDRVMLIRGSAGAGKTTLMQEAVEAIERGGKHVFTFAPSAEASRGVLRREGFADAETVARLLVDTRLQERARGQVLWIDEAGLLGSRTVRHVFDLADRLDCRVVLSGDRQQHGAVERGAVLKVLEDQAGLPVAEVKEIQRQTGAYKEAVRLLAEGRTEAGFDALDALGWVREVADDARDRQLAAEYVAAVTAGKTALVVSPTHAEGDQVTAAVRQALHAAGRLGGDGRTVTSLTRVDLTEAQRGREDHSRPGDVLQFHQNAKGFRLGQRLVVGAGVPVPCDQADRFEVYRPGSLTLATGDRIRVTRGGATRDGHKLETGALYTVAGFTPAGDIRLHNGWEIDRGYGHLAHGYVSTSHASQGKTVDRVFVAQSSRSWPASSREQFYVSASRGRQQVTVYTDDKDALRDAIRQGREKMTGTELVTRDPHGDATRHRLRLERAAHRAHRAEGMTREPHREAVYE